LWQAFSIIDMVKFLTKTNITIASICILGILLVLVATRVNFLIIFHAHSINLFVHQCWLRWCSNLLIEKFYKGITCWNFFCSIVTKTVHNVLFDFLFSQLLRKSENGLILSKYNIIYFILSWRAPCGFDLFMDKRKKFLFQIL
jgi:hypothetical protein